MLITMKKSMHQFNTKHVFLFFSVLLISLFSLSNSAYAQGRGTGLVDNPGLADDWTRGNGKIYYTTGRVGIGTSVPNPNSRLHLSGVDHEYLRITSTGGAQFSNAVAGLELERQLANGSSLLWDIVNQGNFKIRRNTTTLFNLLEDEAQFGTAANRVPLYIWGKTLTKSGSNAENGTLILASHGGLQADIKIMKMDGNSIETDTDLHLNFISNKNVDLARGGGNVGINTSPSGTAKVSVSSDNMQLRLMNTSQGEPISQWYMGVSDSDWLVGKGKLVFSKTSNSTDAAMVITEAGNVGIGLTTPSKMLHVNGVTSTKVLEITGGADLAEHFDVKSGELATPGMVVSIDPQKAGGLRISSIAHDKKVAGIISGAGDIQPGMLMGQEGSIAHGSHPVALTGRVYCLVDASYGEIQPGDLLTTSDTPGHAMKVSKHEQAKGAIIGKAMTSLEEGKGLVLVLVSLQ
jgi:hypothetical protein